MAATCASERPQMIGLPAGQARSALMAGAGGTSWLKLSDAEHCAAFEGEADGTTEAGTLGDAGTVGDAERVGRPVAVTVRKLAGPGMHLLHAATPAGRTRVRIGRQSQSDKSLLSSAHKAYAPAVPM